LALLADPVADQSFAKMEEALPSDPSVVEAACEGRCYLLVCVTLCVTGLSQSVVEVGGVCGLCVVVGILIVGYKPHIHE
jgi:urea transporter